MSEAVDRKRAQSLMAAAGLDALILFQPQHVSYAAGINPGVAALFRRAGAASALVPADPALAVAAVLPDLAEGAARAAGSRRKPRIIASGSTSRRSDRMATMIR